MLLSFIFLLCSTGFPESLETIVSTKKTIEHFEISLSSQVTYISDGKLIIYNRKLNCWKSIDKWRTDHYSPEAKDLNKILRHTTCINGESKNSHFFYKDNTDRTFNFTLATYKPDLDTTQMLVHPFHLSFDHTGLFSHYSNEDLQKFFLSIHNHTQYKKSKSIVGGKHCDVYECTKGSMTTTFSIDSEHKSNILKFSRAVPSDSYLYEIESSFSTDVSRKYGIPTHSHHKTTNGGVVIESEKFEIDIVSVNVPIDPNLFKVSHMNLPDGTSISGDATPGTSVVVMGGKLVKDTGGMALKSTVEQAKAEEEARPRREFLRIALIAAGISAISLGLWLFLRWNRSRR
ncbi:MAG: hypothetical protein ACRC8S_10165 [Fimbriiglobus sp.]